MSIDRTETNTFCPKLFIELLFEKTEETILSLDRKIEQFAAPFFNRESLTNKHTCLNLLRTAPLFILSRGFSSEAAYVMAGITGMLLHSCQITKAKLEISMKLLQAVATAFFLNGLFKMNGAGGIEKTAALLSIPIDLVFSAAFFYLSAKQEQQLRKEIRIAASNFTTEPVSSMRRSEIMRYSFRTT